MMRISAIALRRGAWTLAAAALPLLLAASGAGGRAAAASNAERTPILMELFTSEGCSSCPPVDRWVERLDAAQPVAGAEIIVLSEHVDYWDHDGWKDPFSSPAMTERQKQYVFNLGLRTVYTPQIILDGNAELRPSDPERAQQILAKAANAPMIAVHVNSVTVSAGSPAALNGHIEADSGTQSRGEVFVAVALDKALTDVLAGENSGRKLTNIAVVRKMVRIGKLEKGRTFDQAFSIRLWPDADPANLRVVAFVQEPGPGRVLGAAMTKEIARAGQLKPSPSGRRTPVVLTWYSHR